MDILGCLVGVAVLHVIILVIGIFITLKKKNNDTDCVLHLNMILAGRKIGYPVGIFSLAAMWISGCLIHGSVSTITLKGLLHFPLLWTYPITLLIGGLLFSMQMRKSDCVTMLDPIQNKFGKIMGCVLYIPAFFNEVMCCTGNLAVLVLLVSDMLNERVKFIVIMTVCVMVLYCVFGGWYSIVYTSCLNLVIITIGLCVLSPVMASNKHAVNIFSGKSSWLGIMKEDELGPWIDTIFMMIFGLVPWQSYFQHTLSTRTPCHARVTSYAAALVCFIIGFPIIGMSAVSASTDWNSACHSNISNITINCYDTSSILDVSFEHFTPVWISLVILCVMSAAVMSSADSALFAASSMFAHNIYHSTLRQKASSKEVILVLNIVVVIIAAIATTLALTHPTHMYKYWVLSIDFVYVLLFPQFFAAACFRSVNEYGSIAALMIGFAVRMCSGVKEIGLPVLIEFPFFDFTGEKQCFPFRTFIVLLSILLLIVISTSVNCFVHRSSTELTQDEIDIIRISYREPVVDRVTSFSKIANWSGSYNSITASANDLRHSKEERLLLKATMNRKLSAGKTENRNSYLLHE